MVSSDTNFKASYTMLVQLARAINVAIWGVAAISLIKIAAG